MNKCPCVDCYNKGCGVFHSKCERYLTWAESRRLEMKYLKESNYVSYDFEMGIRKTLPHRIRRKHA